MTQNLERFTSRKFLVALGTILLITFEGSGISEQIVIAVLAGVYLLAQTFIDHKSVQLPNESPHDMVQRVIRELGSDAKGKDQ